MAGLHASPPPRAVSGPDPAPRSRKRCHCLGLIKSIISPEFGMAETACRGLMCLPLRCPNPWRARGGGEAPASSGMPPHNGHREHHPFRTSATKSLHRAVSAPTSPLKAFSITPEMEQNRLSSGRAGRCPAEPLPEQCLAARWGFFSSHISGIWGFYLVQANCDAESLAGASGCPVTSSQTPGKVPAAVWVWC